MIREFSRNQINWHQAFVEVALIGAGVLLALAVDAWWDEQAERSAESEYLLSLQREFETNRETLVASIENELQIIGWGKMLHQHLDSGLSEISEDDLHKLIGEFYWLPSWESVTGTYDEMVGSGRLLYLRNEVLRRKLSQYAHQLENLGEVEQQAWTNWYMEQSPFLRDHINMSKLDWIDGYSPDSPLSIDIQELRSPEFHNLVTSYMSARSDILFSYQVTIEQGDEILMLIQSDLSGD